MHGKWHHHYGGHHGWHHGWHRGGFFFWPGMLLFFFVFPFLFWGGFKLLFFALPFIVLFFAFKALKHGGWGRDWSEWGEKFKNEYADKRKNDDDEKPKRYTANSDEIGYF
jgi:hypothetical protein